MEHEEYQRIQALSSTHWWYQSLIHIATGVLESTPANARILDAGCGTGFLLDTFPNRMVFGADLSAPARATWPQAGITRAAQASLHHLPYPDGTFDVVFCLDVLYHRDVTNDAAAVQELYRVTRPNGRLLLHLAAFDQLYNRHDRVVHTARRYTRARVRDLVSNAGYIVQLTSYRNAFVTLPILLSKLRRSEGSNLARLPQWLNRILLWQSVWEWRWISSGKPIPLGSSVVCIGSRPE